MLHRTSFKKTITREEIKLSASWSNRRDEIEELKKIFFEFLKKWIDGQRKEASYTPKYYDRSPNVVKYNLPRGIIKKEELPSLNTINPMHKYKSAVLGKDMNRRINS